MGGVCNMDGNVPVGIGAGGTTAGPIVVLSLLHIHLIVVGSDVRTGFGRTCNELATPYLSVLCTGTSSVVP